jgi:hypothetical protein
MSLTFIYRRNYCAGAQDASLSSISILSNDSEWRIIKFRSLCARRLSSRMDSYYQEHVKCRK